MTFREQLDFYVVSQNKDIDSQPPECPLDLYKWNIGPNNENVYSATFISPFLLFKLIREVMPNVLLINGMFHWHTTLFGILHGKLLNIDTIISPRGMLQEWALKQRKIKKKVFIKLLKLLLKKDEVWHATDEQEKNDIHKIFGKDQRVHIASNIPRQLSKLNPISFPDQSGRIKLVFLSLINPNKNLHLIIDEINKWDNEFSLDIYGPIADASYWHLCQRKIKFGKRVSYKGTIPPWDVPKTLGQYHFFVLPTLGENFGHAIFDALASGVPVIITQNTPWKALEENKAGFYLDLNDPESLRSKLLTISHFTSSEYNKYRLESYNYAINYLNSQNYRHSYSFLFKKIED